jgi:hypothetical protein
LCGWSPICPPFPFLQHPGALGMSDAVVLHLFGPNPQEATTFPSSAAYLASLAATFTERTSAATKRPAAVAPPVSAPSRVSSFFRRVIVRKANDEVTALLIETSRRRGGLWAPLGFETWLATGARLVPQTLLSGRTLVTQRIIAAANITRKDVLENGALEPMLNACVVCFSFEAWGVLGFHTDAEDVKRARAWLETQALAKKRPTALM